MKDLKVIAGLCFLCIMVSCHKDQLDDIPTEEVSEFSNSASTSTNGFRESELSPPQDLNIAEQPSHTVYFTNIKAPDITAQDASGSIIRVFKFDKNNRGTSPVSLPFESGEGGRSYWYYEVMENSIMISVDAYDRQRNPLPDSEFIYIVLNEKAIRSLEAQGINRKVLYSMSYDGLTKLKERI